MVYRSSFSEGGIAVIGGRIWPLIFYCVLCCDMICIMYMSCYAICDYVQERDVHGCVGCGIFILDPTRIYMSAHVCDYASY